MTDSTEAVRERYAINGTMARVVAFLRERGIDPEHPAYQDFFPFDQLHGRGVEATREHIERAAINSEYARVGPGVRRRRLLARHCIDMRLSRDRH